MQDKFEKAFLAVGLPVDLAKIVVCERPELADYECTGALAGASMLKKSPKAIAKQIIEQIEPDGFTLENVGPGYINITLNDDEIARRIRAPQPNVGEGRRVIIDMGGPNIAKPMHVGHLRSLVIGESLARLYTFLGFKVTKDIHYGDFGFQMGLMLAEKYDYYSTEELMASYPILAARAKVDDEFRTAAQRATRLLQSNDSQMFARWKKIVLLSVKSVKSDIEYMGIAFDLELGESDAFQHINDTIKSLGDGIRESDGAQIIDTEHGVLVFRNGEGGYLYGATDLATLVMRRGLNPAEIIYVVDDRQAEYFKQVFEIGHRYRLTDASLTHVGFGTVNGPDGKPFKTREGNVPKLANLLREATELAFAAKPDTDIARKVALAAIKYADLVNNRSGNYTFDAKNAMKMEGRTGPYLLYQVVRINSILRNAEVAPGKISFAPDERALALTVSRFNNIVLKAFEAKAPHHLAVYLYDLAKQFSVFYANGEEIKSSPSRLALASLVHDRLIGGLTLLGIATVEEM